MEKSKIKEIESTTKEGVWNNAPSEESEEVFDIAFNNTLDKLRENPNLYYIESNPLGNLMVKKRVDDSIVYETDSLEEISKLEESGLPK